MKADELIKWLLWIVGAIGGLKAMYDCLRKSQLWSPVPFFAALGWTIVSLLGFVFMVADDMRWQGFLVGMLLLVTLCFSHLVYLNHRGSAIDKRALERVAKLEVIGKTVWDSFKDKYPTEYEAFKSEESEVIRWEKLISRGFDPDSQGREVQ